VTEVDDIAEVRRAGDPAIFGVVFLLVFAFSYSEETVRILLHAIGHHEPVKWRIGLLVADLGVLLWVGLLKRSISRADHGPPRLWRWWWIGFAITIALDIGLSGLPETPPVYVDLLTSTLFAVAMGILLMSSLNADPLTLFSPRKRAAMPRDWRRVSAVVPLVVGTWSAYLAAAIFVDFFDIDVVRTEDADMAAKLGTLPVSEQLSIEAQLCSSAINPNYFGLVVQVLPVLLLALAVDFNYARRSQLGPAQRATVAATMVVISTGLVFALSAAPWASATCGKIIHPWLEYLAFEISMQGMITALAMLVWLLLVNTPHDLRADTS
jgi:hypothetical protein